MGGDAYRVLSIDACDRARLSARREYLTKEGQIMQRGPDHHYALAATKHFRDFLMASRPAPTQISEITQRLNDGDGTAAIVLAGT